MSLLCYKMMLYLTFFPVGPPMLSNGLISKILISSLHWCTFLFRVYRIRYTITFWLATNKNVSHLTLLCLMDISLLLQCKTTVVNENLLLPDFFVVTALVPTIIFLSVFSLKKLFTQKLNSSDSLNSTLVLMQSRKEHRASIDRAKLFTPDFTQRRILPKISIT